MVEAISVIWVHSRMQICEVPSCCYFGHSVSQSGKTKWLPLSSLSTAVLYSVSYQFNKYINIICVTRVCTAVLYSSVVQQCCTRYLYSRWSIIGLTREQFLPRHWAATLGLFYYHSQTVQHDFTHHRPGYHQPPTRLGNFTINLRWYFNYINWKLLTYGPGKVLLVSPDS